MDNNDNVFDFVYIPSRNAQLVIGQLSLTGWSGSYSIKVKGTSEFAPHIKFVKFITYGTYGKLPVYAYPGNVVVLRSVGKNGVEVFSDYDEMLKKYHYRHNEAQNGRFFRVAENSTNKTANALRCAERMRASVIKALSDIGLHYGKFDGIKSFTVAIGIDEATTTPFIDVYVYLDTNKGPERFSIYYHNFDDLPYESVEEAISDLKMDVYEKILSQKLQKTIDDMIREQFLSHGPLNSISAWRTK